MLASFSKHIEIARMKTHDDFTLVPKTVLRELMDAVQDAESVFACTDELLSVVRRYSYLPIPVNFRGRRVRDVGDRLNAAAREVESLSSDVSAGRKEGGILQPLHLLAVAIADDLPEQVFNYTTRDDLIERLDAMLIHRLTTLRR
jgi:hypothetical protein